MKATWKMKNKEPTNAYLRLRYFLVRRYTASGVKDPINTKINLKTYSAFIWERTWKNMGRIVTLITELDEL